MQELGTTIPTLLTKLDSLQNHSFQMPNISENINRIRQLIQQARNAASKVDKKKYWKYFERVSFTNSAFFLFFPLIQVSVPVKFNGESGVQVRTPPNLADLAAYTSLKLYVTLPESARSRRQGDATRQFVFYLGNKDVSVSRAVPRPD